MEIITRLNPRPNSTRTEPSSPGSILRETTSKLRPEDLTPRVAGLLRDGWQAELFTHSGGNAIIFDAKTASLTRAWAFYTVIDTNPADSGTRERYDQYELLEDGTVTTNTHKRKSKVEAFLDEFRANEKAYGLLEKPKLSPLIESFLNNPANLAFLQSKASVGYRITQSIDPKITIEETESGKLVSLSYFKTEKNFASLEDIPRELLDKHNL